MAHVQKMFSDYGSLGTTIKFQDDFPIIPRPQNKWCEKNWNGILSELGKIGTESDADAFLFLTKTNGSHNGELGIAFVGQACNPAKYLKTSIITYAPASWMNGDLNTAHVILTNNIMKIFCEDQFQFSHIIACRQLPMSWDIF